MIKHIKKYIFDLLILCFLGLIPLLWFRGDEVILGHDAGLTLEPISHFYDRLFAWTDRFAFGTDQTYAIPGFFIHGLEALISSLGLSLQKMQQVIFIFWLILPGLCMYYFAIQIAKKYKLRYFALPASLFYMLNHFLLQGWFVAERTKFSLYAALPLLLAFVFAWTEKKRSTFLTGFYISFLFFLLNGEASLPLFGSVILTMATFTFFYFFEERSFSKFFQLAKLAGLTLVISCILNAYWLLPFGYYVLGSYSKEVAQAGGLLGILGWVNYISEKSSLINLFRLQGIPEWYQNPLHPYANIFLHNPFFITVSFLIPFTAFLSLVVLKKHPARSVAIFFAFLALISMFFMAGSHPPFGAIYLLFVKFIPGFIAFRTPYYKFASSLWLAYAVLIGLTVNVILEYLKKKNHIFFFITSLFLIISFLAYNYPFLNGVFFDYIQGQRTNRVSVPTYVYEFGKWSGSQKRINTKTLSLPPPNNEFKVDSYKWGYWSLAPATSLLTNAPIISSSTYASSDQGDLINLLYKKMESNDSQWPKLAKFLGIKSFLLKKDFAWNLKDSPTAPPSAYEPALHRNDLKLIKKFGEWEVYDFTSLDKVTPITNAHSMDVVMGNVKAMDLISSLPAFDAKSLIYFATDIKKLDSSLVPYFQRVYSKPDCINCDLQYSYSYYNTSTPLLTPKSKLYPLIIIKRIWDEKHLGKEPVSVLNYYLTRSMQDLLIYQKLGTMREKGIYTQRSLVNYNYSLSRINPIINKLVPSFDNIKLIEMNNVFRTEKLILDGEKNNLDADTKQFLLQSLSQLNNINMTFEKYVWQTTDEEHKKYLVTIPKDDWYRISYSNHVKNEVADTLNFTLNEKEYSMPTSSSANHTSEDTKDKIYLKRGTFKMQLNQQITNLVNNSAELNIDNMHCYNSSQIKLNKNDVYRVTFFHQANKSTKLDVAFIIDNKIKTSEFEKINSDLKWQKYSKDYVTDLPKKILSLKICGNPVDKLTTNTVKDLELRIISKPDVLFYTDRSVNDHLLPVSSDKINQTLYSVNTPIKHNNKLFLLNESFSQYWNIENGNSTHFIANGYANGWLHSDPISKPLIIQYKIQRLVEAGFTITGIGVFSTFLYIGWRKRKKHEK